MFKNTTRQVLVDDILIDRTNRQRSYLNFDSVLSLAASIGRSQWISPVLVDEETNYIVAGERRLMSVKALRAAFNGDYSSFTDQVTARETLFKVCTCQVDSWDNWNKIPAQLGRNLTSTDLVMYEFIENAQRKDLPWQDRARAIYDIHAKGVCQSKDWTAIQTADLINVHRATVTENLRVWRIFSDEDTEADLKTIIQESPTLKSALQTIERYTSRRGTDVNLTSGGVTTPKPKSYKPLYNKPGPKPLTPVSQTPASEWLEVDYDDTKLSDQIIFNQDFSTWAESYAGEPFNFIHCDFPYGIAFNDGKLASRVSSTILGNYDDYSEVYWSLLNTLKNNSHIIAPQAHIMFWFSQVHRRETEDFFAALGGVVQPFLMVWHCGDGIIPDPQRYGRRTYETAMLITFGDRKIVAPRALSIESSREASSRIHRSQKPLKVLNHFFEMFVDSSSIVLDPTCGSGTSLITAHRLNAKQVVGLEIDAAIYSNSCDYINSMSTTVVL